jgi:L-amino acid N-acyltransferase YncA
MPSVTIRLARSADADDIQAIYAPIVRDTPVSFEWEPPTAAEIRDRITKILNAGLPWLVCAEGSRALGYAYATQHRARAAYRWSVEVSVYVHERARRRGIGRALYTSLFAVLELQGFQNAYAGATLPNPASVGLHTTVGFREIGIYPKVGFKHGAWHDVIWWYRDLGAHPAVPPLPLTVAEAEASPEWAGALAAGLPFLSQA